MLRQRGWRRRSGGDPRSSPVSRGLWRATPASWGRHPPDSRRTPTRSVRVAATGAACEQALVWAPRFAQAAASASGDEVSDEQVACLVEGVGPARANPGGCAGPGRVGAGCRRWGSGGSGRGDRRGVRTVSVTVVRRRVVVTMVAAMLAGLVPGTTWGSLPASAASEPCVVAAFAGRTVRDRPARLGAAFYLPPGTHKVTIRGRVQREPGGGNTYWKVGLWPLASLPSTYTGSGTTGGTSPPHAPDWDGVYGTRNLAGPGWFWLGGLSGGGDEAVMQVSAQIPAAGCRPGAEAVNGSGSSVSGLVSDPVNAGTGSLLVERSELGFGSGLGLGRTFNGRGGRDGFFGAGWSTVLDASLAPETPGNPAAATPLSYRDATGRVIPLEPDANGGWTSALLPGGRATYDAGSRRRTP